MTSHSTPYAEGRINATDADKRAAFEWLREQALGASGTGWRHAAIALQEVGQLERANANLRREVESCWDDQRAALESDARLAQSADVPCEPVAWIHKDAAILKQGKTFHPACEADYIPVYAAPQIAKSAAGPSVNALRIAQKLERSHVPPNNPARVMGSELIRLASVAHSAKASSSGVPTSGLPDSLRRAARDMRGSDRNPPYGFSYAEMEAAADRIEQLEREMTEAKESAARGWAQYQDMGRAVLKERHNESATADIDAYCEAWIASFIADNPHEIDVEITPQLRKHIEAGLRAVQSASSGRNAVIEECATLADKEYEAARRRFDIGQEWSAGTIAQAIRGLKDAPAKKKWAVEPLYTHPSASEPRLTGWLMWSTGDGAAQEICPTEADVQRFITDSIFGVHTSDDVDRAEIEHHMKMFRNPNAWSGWHWDVRFEDGGIHALKLNLPTSDSTAEPGSSTRDGYIPPCGRSMHESCPEDKPCCLEDAPPSTSTKDSNGR